MSGSNATPRFADRRKIAIPGGESFRTPILVPSFSSKGFPEIGRIVDLTEPFIESEILISAYDIHYKHLTNELNFPSLIFVDSGGFEAAVDQDLTHVFDALDAEYKPKKWTIEFYNSVIESWQAVPPAVFVSYDHPDERLTLDDQIARALSLGGAKRVLARELLLKPAKATRQYLSIDEVCAKARDFEPFVAIGVTEKEIGDSLLSRMVNIGRIRHALKSVGSDQPIHVFGSLDTITTLLYFVMGADVFDGLTWLRYAYYDGATIYRQSLAALKYPPGTNYKRIKENCWHDNYLYLQSLQIQMRTFLNDGDFARFGENGKKVQELYDAALEQVRV